MLSARGILCFAGTLFVGTFLVVGLSAPWFRVEPIEATASSTIIPKKAVSDDFRLVFLAGLEGSGHHYFTGVGEAVEAANPDLPSVHYHLDVSPFYLPVCMGGRASNYAEAELRAMAGMQRLAQEAASLDGPTYYLPEKMLSYPQNRSLGKVMQYNDLRMFAMAAETEGIDLRVVYLKRSARDMLIANTVHRQFQILDRHRRGESEEEEFLEYVRILFTNAAVLHSLLGEIDPGFVVCHDWDSLGEEVQASKVAAFVAPNDEVADMISSALVDSVLEIPHGDGEVEPDINALTFDGADRLALRLQDKLDAFEARYCDPERAV